MVEDLDLNEGQITLQVKERRKQKMVEVESNVKHEKEDDDDADEKEGIESIEGIDAF